MAGLVAAVWSPVTIATPPSPTEPPFASCAVCMHTVPGKTCDEIAGLTPNLDAGEVCQQLEAHHHCDCSGCECMMRWPPTPPFHPPFLPPPPLGPPGQDTIQIVALVMLILVCICLCGSLALVASCLLGWFDEGAHLFPGAPMRQPARRTHHHMPRARTTARPPPSPAPLRLAVADKLRRYPSVQMRQLLTWSRGKAAQRARRMRGLPSPPERLRDGERTPSQRSPAGSPSMPATRGSSSMAGISLCEIGPAATPSSDPAAGGAG
jgi:hypothetical protein